VLAEYAQPALDSQHELALGGASRLMVTGHELLLELALRNLIENALSHALPGTVVEVMIDADEAWLQVTNVHDADGAATTRNGMAVSRLGLGLGHRVVEKVAAIHGALFAEVSCGDTLRCYRITFGQTGTAGPLTIG